MRNPFLASVLSIYDVYFPDLVQQVEEALCRICEGVCHPLRIRVEKIIVAPTDTSVLYALTNLLRYYRKSIGKVIYNFVFFF